jgi:hypothetical protein
VNIILDSNKNFQIKFVGLMNKIKKNHICHNLMEEYFWKLLEFVGKIKILRIIKKKP